MVFFGDGAVDEGAFHESLNLASLWKLPVIFVCENNQYSMGMAVEKAWAVDSLVPRGAAHGVPTEQVDGMDVLTVLDAATRSVEHTRSGKGPVLLEIKTYRFRGHSMTDPTYYRTKEEAEHWRTTRDPIGIFEKHLLDAGIAAQADFDAQDAQAIQIAEEAAEFAENSPFPDPAELYTDVMVDNTTALSYRYAR
jgi:pyruvate dehydrogenase E1 component alpha subunit